LAIKNDFLPYLEPTYIKVLPCCLVPLTSLYILFIIHRPSQNATLIILALPLAARPDFLAGQVARALQHAAFAELAAHRVVHAVLEAVDVLVACDLRFR
jgi:hypothetical protein